MRALVTGANGLLGNHLCRELLLDGHDVTAFVRKTSDLRGLDDLKVEIAYGDVRDAASLIAAAQGCDVMYHAAAMFTYSGYDVQAMEDTAKKGATFAIEAAKEAGMKRVVLTSTTALLGGNFEPEPLDENANMDRNNVPDYFWTKALQEETALACGKEMGVEVVAANPGMFVGSYDYKPGTALKSLLTYVDDPMKMTFPGGISISHAQDIARGHIMLATRGTPFERHILSSENLTWKQTHTLMAELLGIAKPRVTIGGKTAVLGAAFMEAGAKLTGTEPMATRALAKQANKYFWYDTGKAEALGYSPRTAKQTLIDTLGWWLYDSPLVSDKLRKRLKPSQELQAYQNKR